MAAVKQISDSASQEQKACRPRAQLDDQVRGGRSMGERGSRVLAVIDLGTNAVRLLIARVSEGDSLERLYADRVITRLGEGLIHSGCLSDSARERTLKVLYRFKRRVEEYGVERVKLVATSVLREASNAQDFVDDVLEGLGWQIDIITGEEEGRHTLLGILAGLAETDQKVLAIDIGGGSTELILARGRDPERLFSLPLGVVYLTERYLSQDPIDETEYHQLISRIREELMGIRDHLPLKADTLLVATAGTATTLAALDLGLSSYEADKIHRHILRRDKIDHLLTMLKRKSLAERRALPGIEPGRADLIIAGTAILLELMNTFQQDKVMTSEWGLREGLLLSLAKDEPLPHLGQSS